MNDLGGLETVDQQKYFRLFFFLNWDVLRIVLSLLFIFAVLMKGTQLLTAPSLNEGFFDSRLFVTFLVLGEFALVLWLLFGFFPRLTCYFLILLFFVFMLYSLYRGLVLKAESCNCYGSLKINLMITVCLDLFLVVLLTLFCKHIPKDRGRHIKDLIFPAAIWFFAAVPFLYFVSEAEAKTIARVGIVQEAVFGKKTVLLQPESWSGGEFVLANYTNIQEKLSRGLWIVLVYTNSCSSCREAVNIYREIAEKYSQKPEYPKIAMIELPPYQTEETDLPVLAADSTEFIDGKFRDLHSFYLIMAKFKRSFPTR